VLGPFVVSGWLEEESTPVTRDLCRYWTRRSGKAMDFGVQRVSTQELRQLCLFCDTEKGERARAVVPVELRVFLGWP
jgi:hypothetical protein